MLGISTTNARVGGFRGLGKIAKLIIAYFARVTAAGGVYEGKECLATKLNSLDAIQLLDNASLVTIPSGYKSGVVYSQVPTSGAGDLDFTRASTATRINSSSLIESVATGVPRLTYPIGGGCPSLLFEAERTNLVTYSNDFSNAAWTKSGTIVTPNYAISPDGTQNATRLQLPFPNTQLFQAVGVQDSSTSSIYIKGTAGQTIALYNSFLGAGTYELRTLNGEWQRITVSSVGTILSYFAISNFLSATATDILIYGSQLELGSYPTSYIPTTTATVTRLADTSETFGLSSLIGQTEGTFFIDAKFLEAAVEGWTIYDGVSIFENSINIGCAGGTIRALISSNSVYTAVDSGVNGLAQFNKIALVYKNGASALFVNGTKYAFNPTVSFISTLSVLRLGEGFWFGNRGMQQNQMLFYKTALSDAKAIALTTI